MSQRSKAEQSGVQHSDGAFAFPSGPPSLSGPKTVVNPECRDIKSTEIWAMFPADASEWKRLFPIDRDAQADSDPIDSSDANGGPVGVELGHFVIEGLIGRGGMGAVFRAIDQRLQRIVALKVLTPDLSRETAAVQRFQNEAQASARLDHDNIARVYYIGEDRGLHLQSETHWLLEPDQGRL